MRSGDSRKTPCFRRASYRLKGPRRHDHVAELLDESTVGKLAAVRAEAEQREQAAAATPVQPVCKACGRRLDPPQRRGLVMTRARSSGGGSLDGAETSFADYVTSVTTKGGSHYVLDDNGTFTFTGFGETGEIMTEIIRHQHDDEQRDREALEAATRARGCGRCGRTYAGSAAYQVAHDPGWPGCVPPDVAGLIEVDGVWCVPGAAGR